MGRIRGVLILVAVYGFAAACGSGNDAAQSTTIPTDDAVEDDTTATTPPIGDSCLVGRWVTEIHQGIDMSFNDEKVPVSGERGLVITYSAAGTESQDANNSQPLIGAYHGQQLSVLLRGQGTFSDHADGQQLVETGPDQPFTLQFFLNGDPQDTNSTSNAPNASNYTCDDTTLVVTAADNPQDRQTLTRS